MTFDLLQELYRETSPKNKGVVLVGGVGCGKTAIIEQLIELSCFGEGRDTLLRRMDSAEVSTLQRRAPSVAGSTSSLLQQQQLSLSTTSLSQRQPLSYDSLQALANCVVAYHMCQADNNITCMVPEFVHSLAAYMAGARQLPAYREMLLADPHLQNALSIRNCIQDPSKAFVKGILEPLTDLKRSGKIQADLCLILVDSLNEAEFHKPDYGDTIASFLTKHIMKFPPWLKCVVTVRTVLQDLTKFLPFHRIYLDRMHPDLTSRDLSEYILHRIQTSSSITSNIALNGRLDPATQSRFIGHVQSLTRGSFLYCKLLLDLIERGSLVLKSSNYKILPVSLAEVFLLQFNLKFPTIRSYERVCPILNVCLASLYPLTMEEIYETVNSAYVYKYVAWEDFTQRMDSLASFLIRRKDGTFMFHHPAFREWLIRREERDSSKFLCDLR